MSDQQPLIDGASAKKPRTIRKTRDDKGRKRKPDPTARDQAMLYFAGLDVPGKQRFLDDCGLILKFCDPVFRKAFNDYAPPAAHDHEWERKTVALPPGHGVAPYDRCRICGLTKPMTQSEDA